MVNNISHPRYRLYRGTVYSKTNTFHLISKQSSTQHVYRQLVSGACQFNQSSDHRGVVRFISLAPKGTELICTGLEVLHSVRCINLRLNYLLDVAFHAEFSVKASFTFFTISLCSAPCIRNAPCCNHIGIPCCIVSENGLLQCNCNCSSITIRVLCQVSIFCLRSFFRTNMIICQLVKCCW